MSLSVARRAKPFSLQDQHSGFKVHVKFLMVETYILPIIFCYISEERFMVRGKMHISEERFMMRRKMPITYSSLKYAVQKNVL